MQSGDGWLSPVPLSLKLSPDLLWPFALHSVNGSQFSLCFLPKHELFILTYKVTKLLGTLHCVTPICIWSPL